MRTIELRGREVMLIDQTALPEKVKFVRCRSAEDVAEAIRSMRIRGAPALAAAAGMAIALTAMRSRARTRGNLLREIRRSAKLIESTRPTAVNLFVGVRRVMEAVESAGNVEEMRRAAVEEAKRIAEEDVETNVKIGENGARLLRDGDTVMTHCNAGALATVDYGTALGVIRAAWRSGKKVSVIACETRPLLQGARLTAWELKRDGIPVTVITDNMAGAVMRSERISAVIVGADRIAANGDTANKIGTYSLAVLAKEHGVPFYVAAPTSTIDMSVGKGEDIPIEHRSPDEVRFIGGKRVVPDGVPVMNPAFDVTPAWLISAIITERGVVRPGELKKLFRS
ncbi:MAG: S-methyl-5-thioribose-1-phosphate isomerase [Candidatus Hadarchaeales archaeon]